MLKSVPSQDVCCDSHNTRMGTLPKKYANTLGVSLLLFCLDNSPPKLSVLFSVSLGALMLVEGAVLSVATSQFQRKINSP